MLPDISNNTKRQDRAGAVFKIKCSEFQATYIGETGRNLTTRLKEHKINELLKGWPQQQHRRTLLKTSHVVDEDSATCLTSSTAYHSINELYSKAGLLPSDKLL